MSEKENSYITHKRRLLKSFDKSIERGKQTLIDYCGIERAGSLINEARREYEIIIPRIPFIGHRSPFLLFFLPASRYLAIYIILRKNKIDFEEASHIISLMNQSEWNAIPFLLRCIIKLIWFSPLFEKRLKKRAKESQKRKYPDGYVLNFIEGDGRSFDYGIDYTKCTACKFLKQQGAVELAPLMCSFDKSASEILGWGLTRTMTLANGDEKCDFRFKKGGKTNITP
jgi:hypothetical protein